MTNFQEDDEPGISYSVVKKVADKVTRRAKIISPPISLNQVFKSLPRKIRVIGKDLGNEDGFCVNDDLIVYNNTKSMERNRFTVAHEFGHIQLGHNSSSHYSSIDSQDPNEKMANTFAAELLVPGRLLRKESLWSMSLTQLAKKYQVSKKMMMWKLKSNRLDLKIGSWD